MLDFYAIPVKQFSFEGRAKMHSSIGISMTIFTIILLIGYLASQIKVMVGGEQPIISITNELN